MSDQLGENQWDEDAVTHGATLSFCAHHAAKRAKRETRVRDAKLIGEQLKNIERMGRA